MIRTLLALLMVLALPLQGLGQAMGRIAAPAHYHPALSAHEHAGGTAHRHHGDRAGAAALGPIVDHHGHALDDDDVIYVADGFDPPAQGGSSVKAPPLEGVLPGDGGRAPPSTAIARVFPPATGVSFSSHVAGPLRRPPRSRALS